MARWVLGCPECNKYFTHSEILADSNRSMLDSFVNIPKPEFPKGGLKMECPNCKKTSLFQRHELIYRR